MAFWIAMVCCVVPLLGGLACAARYEAESRAEAALVAAVIALSLIVVPIHALAWLGLLTRSGALLAVMLPALALIAWSWRQAESAQVFARALCEPLRLPLDALRLAWRDKHIAGIGLLAFIAIVAASLWIGWLAPTTSWDSLWYHEAIVGFSLQLHGASIVPLLSQHDYINGYPRLAEYLPLWLVLTGSRELIDCAQSSTIVLLLLATFVLLRRAGAEALTALGLALALVLMPGVVLQLRSTLIDVTVAAFAVTALSLVLRERLRGRDLLLGALSCGVLAGTKASGVVIAGAVFGVLLLRYAFTALRASRARAALGPVLAACAIVLAIGAPHYVRNALSHGNPIWPLALKHPMLGLDLKGDEKAVPPSMSASYVVKSLLSPPELGKETSDTRDNGYGNVAPYTVLPLGLLAALALLVHVARTRARKLAIESRELGLCVVLGIGALAALAIPALWWARLHVHLVAILLALCAWWLREPRHQRVVDALAGALIVGHLVTLSWSWASPGIGVNAAQIAKLTELTREQRLTLDLGARTRLPKAIARALEEHVQRDDVVVTDGRYLFLANLWNQSFSNRVVYEKCGGRDYMQRLEAHRPRWVVVRNEPCGAKLRAAGPQYELVGPIDNALSVFRRHD